MVKDVLKLLLAILVVLAILVGIAYLFMGPVTEKIDQYATGMAQKEMVAEGVKGVTDIFKGQLGK